MHLVVAGAISDDFLDYGCDTYWCVNAAGRHRVIRASDIAARLLTVRPRRRPPAAPNRLDSRCAPVVDSPAAVNAGGELGRTPRRRADRRGSHCSASWSASARLDRALRRGDGGARRFPTATMVANGVLVGRLPGAAAPVCTAQPRARSWRRCWCWRPRRWWPGSLSHSARSLATPGPAGRPALGPGADGGHRRAHHDRPPRGRRLLDRLEARPGAPEQGRAGRRGGGPGCHEHPHGPCSPWCSWHASRCGWRSRSSSQAIGSRLHWHARFGGSPRRSSARAICTAARVRPEPGPHPGGREGGAHLRSRPLGPRALRRRVARRDGDRVAADASERGAVARACRRGGPRLLALGGWMVVAAAIDGG